MAKNFDFLKNYKRDITLSLLGIMCIFFAVQAMPVSAQDDELPMFSDEAMPESIEEGTIQVAARR